MKKVTELKRSELSVAIQAGGLSRRMGLDKASLPFCGRPLIQWVIERALIVADEIIVVANQPDKYQFLDCPIYPDELPGSGPLGGLYTALLHAQSPCVGVLACDMPFASPDLLAFQHQLLTDTGVDVVIPENDQGLEPFHAVYRRETCLSLIRNAIQSGEMRVVGWLPEARVHFLKPDEIRPYDPQQWAFHNLNTPEQFRLAEQEFTGVEWWRNEVILRSNQEATL